MCIAKDAGEGGHPTRVFVHTKIRCQFFGFVLGIEQNLQGMQGQIVIPNPVVGPEGSSLVVMDFPVKAAIVFSVFGNVDHTFMRTVQRSVEHDLFILCSALDLDFAKCLVPGFSGACNKGLGVEVLDFCLQIVSGLFCADV